MCESGVPSTCVPVEFLRRLAYNLMADEEVGRAYSSLLPPNAECEFDEKYDASMVFENLILGPLRQLPPPRPRLLVVDAYDELDTSESSTTISSLLATAVRRKQLPKWIRLIVTSRPNQLKREEMFNACRGQMWYFTLGADTRNSSSRSRTNKEDLEEYIKFQLPLIAKPPNAHMTHNAFVPSQDHELGVMRFLDERSQREWCCVASWCRFYTPAAARTLARHADGNWKCARESLLALSASPRGRLSETPHKFHRYCVGVFLRVVQRSSWGALLVRLVEVMIMQQRLRRMVKKRAEASFYELYEALRYDLRHDRFKLQQVLREVEGLLQPSHGKYRFFHSELDEALVKYWDCDGEYQLCPEGGSLRICGALAKLLVQTPTKSHQPGVNAALQDVLKSCSADYLKTQHIRSTLYRASKADQCPEQRNFRLLLIAMCIMHAGAGKPEVLSVAQNVFEAIGTTAVDQKATTTVLQMAVRYDKPDLAKRLIDAGASPNWTHPVTKDTLVHYAAFCGLEGMTRCLLGAGADATGVSIVGQTALHYAAAKGYGRVVEQLTTTSANAIDRQDAHGVTALMQAVAQGSKRAVRALLRANADVDRPRNDQSTALHVAAKLGNVQISKQLLDSHASPHSQDDRGISPLIEAARNGQADVARLLLRSDTPNGVRRQVHGVDKKGMSPLHHAASCEDHGGTDVVDLLLESGADVNATSHGGRDTALHCACLSANHATMRRLIQYGAPVNAQNAEGMTTLCQAVADDNEDAVDLMLAADADLNIPSKSGTPLLMAICEAQVSIAITLLDAGADPNITDSQGRPLLQIVVDLYDCCLPWSAGVYGGLIDCLVKADADVNGVNSKLNMSILCIAAHYGLPQVVQRLLAAGADANFTPDAASALHIAARGGHATVVKLLLKHDARVDSEDADGRTALCIAAKYGHCDVANALLSAGASRTPPNSKSPLELAEQHKHLMLAALLRGRWP